ncbi:hypothetical protein GCM10023330_14420 [Litoribaculum gwangyangense]|uniref:Transposase n=1 Tax=Litoribaculum gwangyangense TaxID=1130722 RepID=A0ABP9CIB5_9FLAO
MKSLTMLDCALVNDEIKNKRNRITPYNLFIIMLLTNIKVQKKRA